MMKHICSKSFLMVLGSRIPNFDARILSVQNLMSIILLFCNFMDFVHICTVYGEILTFKHY